MLPSEITGLAALALILAQSTTNVFRKATEPYGLPGWTSLLVAYAVSLLSAFLLTVQAGTVLNPQTVATAILAGLVAGMGAVATTELTKSASPNLPAASPTVRPLPPALTERIRARVRATAAETPRHSQAVPADKA